MVREATLKQTDAGLVPDSEGWFVVNARDARWIERPGRGHNLPFTGWRGEEAESYFPQLGVALVRLEPGEPIGMYHWEADAEAFLLLSGEAVLLIEGQERQLQPWDFVHCPPSTAHMIVGAGDGPSVVFAISSRQYMGTPEWGAYTVDEVALEHGAGVGQETNDAGVAYARFPGSQDAPYREGLLP